MPRRPPQLNPSDKANFKTLCRAFEDGRVAVISAIRKADQKPVALVCAMGVDESDGALIPSPLAVMIEGNPFEDFEDPTEVGRPRT